MPEFIRPMLATPVDRAFSDPDWLFEMKLDGYRVEAVVHDGRVKLWTRNRKDAATYFPAFAASRTDWLAGFDAIVDGEMVALDPEGRPSFSLLQDLSGLRGLGAHRGRAAPRRTGVRGGRAQGHARLPRLRPAPPRRPGPAGRAAGGAQEAAPARHPRASVRPLRQPRARARRGLPGRGHRRRSSRAASPSCGPAATSRDALAQLAEDQGPARAGARRRRLRARQGQPRGPRRAARGDPGGLAWRYAGEVGSGIDGRTRTLMRHLLDEHAVEEPPVPDAPPVRGVAGASRAMSSAPSSPNGPRTACCDRHPSRVVRSAVTRRACLASGWNPPVKRARRRSRSSIDPPPSRMRPRRPSPSHPTTGRGRVPAGEGRRGTRRAYRRGADVTASPMKLVRTEPDPETPARSVTAAELDALRALGKGGRWEVGGHAVDLTNLDKVLFPRSGFTKRDLVALLHDDRAGHAALPRRAAAQRPSLARRHRRARPSSGRSRSRRTRLTGSRAGTTPRPATTSRTRMSSPTAWRRWPGSPTRPSSTCIPGRARPRTTGAPRTRSSTSTRARRRRGRSS